MMSFIEISPLAFIGATPGPFELMILFGAVLLLFGPKRLPELARTIGKVMFELRKASNDFKSQVMDIENSIDAEFKELDKEVRDLQVGRGSNFDVVEEERCPEDPSYDEDYRDPYCEGDQVEAFDEWDRNENEDSEAPADPPSETASNEESTDEPKS